MIPLKPPTDFQSDDEVGRAVAPEYQDCACTTGRVFLPIYFHCDLEENKRRVESEERRRSVKTKLQSPQALEGIYLRSSLYQFGVPEELSIDVTSAVSTAVATKIYSHILLHE